MNMNIEELAESLTTGEHEILTSSKIKSISYPEDGNLQYFQLEDASFWFRHRNNCITSVIKQFPPTGPIIDVGGGNGYVTKRILDEGFEAVLLEPGTVGALIGKTRRKIPIVICSVLEDAGFPQASLSAVGLFDVIEHIQDDYGFIEQIHRILKPNGLLYSTVPAYQWLWSLSDVTAQHYRRYNRTMIVDLFALKFDVLFFTYFFGALTLPIFFLRTLPFRLGLSKSGEVFSPEMEHGSKGGPV